MRVEQYKILDYEEKFIKTLVCDIPSYQFFIPHCSDSSIEEVALDGSIIGSLTIQFGPFKKSFTTRNAFSDDGKRLLLDLDEGPFKSFFGYWSFEPLENKKTKVGFCLDFSFHHSYFDKPFEHAVGYVYSHIIDAFAKEAEKRTRNNSE